MVADAAAIDRVWIGNLELRQSEIQDLYPATAGQKQVFGLQIAVDDIFSCAPLHPSAMSRAKSTALRAGIDPSCNRWRRLSPSNSSETRYATPESTPVSWMERDVGVVERGDRPRFLPESPHGDLRPREFLGQNLNRHLAPQPGIARPIHFAHFAGSNRREYFVWAQTAPGRNWHELDSLPMIEKAKSRPTSLGYFWEPRVRTYDFRALASDRVALSRRAGTRAAEQAQAAISRRSVWRRRHPPNRRCSR